MPLISQKQDIQHVLIVQQYRWTASVLKAGADIAGDTETDSKEMEFTG